MGQKAIGKRSKKLGDEEITKIRKLVRGVKQLAKKEIIPFRRKTGLLLEKRAHLTKSETVVQNRETMALQRIKYHTSIRTLATSIHFISFTYEREAFMDWKAVDHFEIFQIIRQKRPAINYVPQKSRLN